MKKITIILIIFFAFFINTFAQENESPFSLGINIKGYYSGLELAFEHKLCDNIYLQTSLGFNSLLYKEINYSNNELIFRFKYFLNTNKGFNIGTYIKTKLSYYSKLENNSYPATHETAIYYIGTGIHTGYKFLLGKDKHFIIEPFVSIGGNYALLSDEIYAQQPNMPKLYKDIELDTQAGIGFAWAF